ncbi:restriction endonuclease subunit S [Lentilactobacillus hilgardii]|uniref:restriction endonuclease subunit S n=1 Tax=Lentilactobacillus hilgardii TaxID=1588 RepID=UPI00019C5272|nr:restriction endonuclease subunit S [Lentilactobacillus hilgardii]EEI71944.1 type I restriction modification DNA specificity domain protein [Lentilactobacillus hilgardii ATCC 27305]
MSEEKQPKIRFKGFDDPWEQRKLGEGLKQLKSYSLPRKYEVPESDTEYIHYGDIHTSSRKYVDKSFRLPNIKSGDFQLLQTGDIVLADASEDYKEIAEPMLMKNIKGRKVVSGLHTIAIRLKCGDPVYYLYLFLSPGFRHYVYKVGTGLKVFGINYDKVQKYFLAVPDEKEQKYIGKILFLTDQLIAANQSKLEQLKRLKKLLMQKIFNQEWRFKGFTDPWEQRKLGEVKTIKDGTHDSPRYVPKGYPLVTSKNLNDSGLNLSDVSYISESDFDSINKRSKVNVGDIIFGMIGTIGNPVLLDESNFAIKNVALLKNDGPIQNHWLIQYLKSDVFNRLTSEKTAGNTQKFIGLNVIRNLIIDTPSIHEQVIIGSFLKLTDSIIAANQRRLDHLQSLKKYLMQNMFV